VLRGARLDDAVVDVLLADGRISDIAPRIESPSDSAAEEIRLDGRWLIPGLWDNHTHMNQWALATHRASVHGATSAREAAEIAREVISAGRVTIGEDGQALPVVANGFRDGAWADAPTLAALDAAGGSVPVVLVSSDLHSVWLNSAALDRFGYSGHPTGLLREDDAFDVERRVNAIPDAVLDTWVHDASRNAAARGIVGLVDLEMAWNLDSWSRRMAEGHDSVRVEFGIYTEHLDRAIDAGLRTGLRVGELLTVGRHKVLTDGSLGTRTAYCFDEYPGLRGSADAHGILTVAPEELRALLRRSSAAGLQPTVHAIGDHANSHVLDVFEQLGIRGRVEHAQLLTQADVARFGALGLEASVQPEHAMDDRDIADVHWAGRTGRAFMLRSLLEAGARLMLGSDAPVAPLDPWVTIGAAVARTRDGREPWHPEQSLTLAQALHASVRSIVAVGEPADLVVLDADPLALSGEQLRSMPVSATLLGGRFTHRTV
jgi:predicted amidohydrolase YtcJ